MTIGSHTWSHKDLAKNPYAKDVEQAKQEIEMGVSAVHMAVGGPTAPFFRFPDLQQPRDAMAYLGTRNIAIFSTDIDTFDFKLRRWPEHGTSTRPATTHGPNRASSRPSASEGSPKKKIGIDASRVLPPAPVPVAPKCAQV
jgi:peptidoglycan/xylan/chitin deacetylase (PgdA/CDA1 family)